MVVGSAILLHFSYALWQYVELCTDLRFTVNESCLPVFLVLDVQVVVDVVISLAVSHEALSVAWDLIQFLFRRLRFHTVDLLPRSVNVRREVGLVELVDNCFPFALL